MRRRIKILRVCRKDTAAFHFSSDTLAKVADGSVDGDLVNQIAKMPGQTPLGLRKPSMILAVLPLSLHMNLPHLLMTAVIFTETSFSRR